MMRDKLNGLEVHKVTRAAFLYLDPKGNKSQFAQCGTCMMFTGDTCTIHGKPILGEKGHEMVSK